MAGDFQRQQPFEFEPPYEAFDNSMLGAEFAQELAMVSRLWFACGYRPGIAAYLNFFLLRDFIATHDTAFPPRFQTFRSMADSFYRTDLFIRDVTDSGAEPTGGISSKKVRAMLRDIMRRHATIAIPGWMMTYFGFSLLENVEKQCGPLTDAEKRLHLAYISKAYRIMGIAFSDRRPALEQFARQVEQSQAGLSPDVEKHARHILLIGEMVGVTSALEALAPMLPDATRAVFADIYDRVRPSSPPRWAARGLGRLLMKRALGQSRVTAPVAE